MKFGYFWLSNDLSKFILVIIDALMKHWSYNMLLRDSNGNSRYKIWRFKALPRPI